MVALAYTINWPKLQIEIVDWNDAIFTCFQGDISVWILRTKLYLLAEAYSKPIKASKMELLLRTVKAFK